MWGPRSSWGGNRGTGCIHTSCSGSHRAATGAGGARLFALPFPAGSPLFPAQIWFLHLTFPPQSTSSDHPSHPGPHPPLSLGLSQTPDASTTTASLGLNSSNHLTYLKWSQANVQVSPTRACACQYLSGSQLWVSHTNGSDYGQVSFRRADDHKMWMQIVVQNVLGDVSTIALLEWK